MSYLTRQASERQGFALQIFPIHIQNIPRPLHRIPTLTPTRRQSLKAVRSPLQSHPIHSLYPAARRDNPVVVSHPRSKHHREALRARDWSQSRHYFRVLPFRSLVVIPYWK